MKKTNNHNNNRTAEPTENTDETPQETPNEPTDGPRTETRGRPAHYKTPEALQEAVNAYFDNCDKGIKREIILKGKVTEITKRKPYQVAGLAYALGFKSRSSFTDYADRDELFSHIIRNARLRIEIDLIEGAQAGEYDGKFSGLVAQSSFGYSTKEKIEQTGTRGDINVHFTGERTVKRMADLEKRLAKYENVSQIELKPGKDEE